MPKNPHYKANPSVIVMKKDVNPPDLRTAASRKDDNSAATMMDTKYEMRSTEKYRKANFKQGRMTVYETRSKQKAKQKPVLKAADSTEE